MTYKEESELADKITRYQNILKSRIKSTELLHKGFVANAKIYETNSGGECPSEPLSETEYSNNFMFAMYQSMAAAIWDTKCEIEFALKSFNDTFMVNEPKTGKPYKADTGVFMSEEMQRGEHSGSRAYDQELTADHKLN